MIITIIILKGLLSQDEPPLVAPRLMHQSSLPYFWTPADTCVVANAGPMIKKTVSVCESETRE